MNNPLFHSLTSNSILSITDPEEEVSFKIHLKSDKGIIDNDAYENLFNEHPKNRKYLTKKQHKTAFKVDKNHIDAIKKYAEDNNLKVVNYDPSKREVEISGAAKDVSKSLGILHTNNINYSDEGKAEVYKGYEGTPTLDDSIKDHVQTITGLNHVPQQESRIPLLKTAQAKQISRVAPKGYSSLRLSEAYNFPDGDGEGQCVGLIELGGTYQQKDIDTYFKYLGLDTPEIEVVGSTTNISNTNNVEVTADIQVIGALIPKAKIVIYYGKTILDAMKEVLADPKNNPSVISISWAGSEFNYSQSQIEALYQAFYEASLLGITIVAASGDYGAYNKPLSPPYINFPNVNIPASIPLVLGCGGSDVTLNQNTIADEVVWFQQLGNKYAGTGGGFSTKFKTPNYQIQSHLDYQRQFPQFTNDARGIPDVGASASNEHGYSMYYLGNWYSIGGTSLSTPLWAGLIMRFNQNLGYRLGYFHDHLYKLLGTDAFHPIDKGNNGFYTAANMWDPCTGLGSPDGKNILEKLNQ